MKKQIAIAISLIVFALGASGCTNSSPPDNDALYEKIAELELLLDEKVGEIEELNSEVAALEFALNEEVHSFQRAIADLIYDHEYETVKALLSYHREAVETALEIEFGTSNLPAIIQKPNRCCSTG